MWGRVKSRQGTGWSLEDGPRMFRRVVGGAWTCLSSTREYEPDTPTATMPGISRIQGLVVRTEVLVASLSWASCRIGTAVTVGFVVVGRRRFRRIGSIVGGATLLW